MHFGHPPSTALVVGVAIAAAVGCSIGPAVAEDWSPLHLEEFELASGPRDVDGHPLELTWCRIDGARASSGFCPTGAAWRLAPGDELVASFSTSLPCGGVRIRVLGASVDAIGSWMRLGEAGDCGPPAGTVVGLPAVGGACQEFGIEASTGPGDILQWRVRNEGPAVLLLDGWLVEGRDCDDSISHPCCETGEAGCDDLEVMDCVCAVDPHCCKVAWDEICVEEVGWSGCGACDDGCDTVLSTDFGTGYVPGGACLAWPGIFEHCEGEGPFVTISGACAGVGDAALRFGGGIPWSTAETGCLDFRGIADAVLRCSVSVPAGVPGPVFEARVGDDPPLELGRVPVSTDPGCRTIEVDLGPLVGRSDVRLRLRSGSSVGQSTRLDDLEIEFDPAHSPCETGGTIVDDEVIRACTCDIDAYCCEIAWDELCVSAAMLACGAPCETIPTCGQGAACDVADHLPGCADAACCAEVCPEDPFCCLVGWDEACVEAAESCGGPDPDLDGDGDVDGGDLGLLMAAWGTDAVAMDLDQDGTVGGGDLGVLLAAWTTR